MNYKYEDDRHFDTDKELMTATVWDVVEESNGLSSPGDIGRIAHFTGLGVFREEACQFNTKLADVRVAQHATTIDQQIAADEDEEKSTIVIT
ncbi:hypothetical protein GN958_ATG22416 [Phytophthora infestans]|uniref:Uncharacterized protein n=1 Tax=Phytophthora infestans TaxID=4787 RepID=A0A8S9TQU9_PHYIN|nr:hypothetical protein GN958_ATG22416 [Phytophthora infestans]